MDSLIFEMEKLLSSGREDCDIQDIIGESAGKSIDDLLFEADKIISETLPYFQTTSNQCDVSTPKNFDNIKVHTKIKTTKSKSQQNDTKKVIFNLKSNPQNNEMPEKRSNISDIYGKLTTNKYIIDEERKKKKTCSSSLKKITTSEFEVPEVNFMKNQLQVSSNMIENHTRLQVMCNIHDKLPNNMELLQDQLNSKLKVDEELNYYKLRNNELEENLMFKEQEIRNWENRYQQLNQYCELFLKKNIEETLKKYDCQLNELIERNITRESQLHNIISNLLEEIDQSHLQYRIQLSEKNKQIRKYLDQIERILGIVYEFKNNNTKIQH